MGWVLFILIGGTAAMVVPFLIARTLVYRHSRQHGWAIAAKGELQVATAEAARRAAVRAELAKHRVWAQRRPAPDPRRPVAAVSSTPHDDTRWSALTGGR